MAGLSSAIYKVMTMFTKIIDGVTRACFFLATLSLGLIVAVFSIEVIMRYFFASPTFWALDTVTFLFCASLMLALPEVTRTDGHIAVSIILDFSSRGFANKFRLIIYLVSLVVVSYVAYITLVEFLRLFETGINTLGSFRVPKWMVFGLIPLGLFLSALQFILLLKKQLSEVHLDRKGA
ncbi:TRAP-type C4-dicarboxylate transport system permease small subunit [Modicisalibacter xianhensis]|uniref:TRAP transporter small permease protein n=2 Tax=Modicisalibacter xianhensis TaxID=442341 RepID=A0A4V3GSI4_9GAMM|nr:TRAP-type C4-dicarboxylate transport system permease small subunit [Halomonas xianhensis]